MADQRNNSGDAGFNDPLRFAAVVAHQLKSPIGAAETVLQS